jgi:hypothetical protein
MFQILFLLHRCRNALFLTSMPAMRLTQLTWREKLVAIFPINNISLGGRDFHIWQGALSWHPHCQLVDWEDVLFWKSSSYLYSYEELGKHLVHSVRFFVQHRRKKVPSAEVEKGISTAFHGVAFVVRAANVTQNGSPTLIFFELNCALSNGQVAMT